MGMIGILAAIGVLAGVLSGLVGIGGGVVIVPALVYLLGFTQQQAQGTTLALMVPPIGVLAALTYYQQGFVNIKAAVIICIAFVLGSIIGAKVAVGLPAPVLKKIFGSVILLIAIKMLAE